MTSYHKELEGEEPSISPALSFYLIQLYPALKGDQAHRLKKQK